MAAIQTGQCLAVLPCNRRRRTVLRAEPPQRALNVRAVASGAKGAHPLSGQFTEEAYLLQQQSVERAQWAAGVRSATGSRHHQFWEPKLDPPPLLDDVTLVLVSPRRPASLGTVARSASCFEVSGIRVVQPRCNFVSRHSKSASKGAQYLLYKAQTYDSLADATADCELSVAFSRWVAGRSNAFYDVAALLSHPTVQALIRDPVPERGSQEPVLSGHPAAGAGTAAVQQESLTGDTPRPHPTNDCAPSQHSGMDVNMRDSPDSQPQAGPHQDENLQQQQQGRQQGRQRRRIALVFGREELGLSDAEVDACDAVCSIPIGRLQESLSLSHAVSIVLSALYSQRLAFVTGTSDAGAVASGEYVVSSVAGLAEGYDASESIE